MIKKLTASELTEYRDSYWIYCSGHNYITLMFGNRFVHCYDNTLYSSNSASNEYYMENIIAQIEKRTRMNFCEIPIKGEAKDFDGLRFLNGGFKKGAEFLINKNFF